MRRLPSATTQAELLALVAEFNADPTIHGILVQFPVPAHIDPIRVQAAIAPDKDVDGLSVANAGRLAIGSAQPDALHAARLHDDAARNARRSDRQGRREGRSNLVGKPMAQLLLQANCTVTVAHSRTRDLPAVARQADILIAAVGRPEMVRGALIKPGAVVIDVGMNRILSRKPKAAAAGKTIVVGDVAFDEASQVAGWITPVPGGVGPMTVACLLQNTITAAKRQNGSACVRHQRFRAAQPWAAEPAALISGARPLTWSRRRPGSAEVAAFAPSAEPGHSLGEAGDVRVDQRPAMAVAGHRETPQPMESPSLNL